MAAKTLRDLVAGSGTLSVTTGSEILTFSSSQSFKRGATVSYSGQVFTIVEGSGTTWVAKQKSSATASGQSFNVSDPSASARTRGSSGLIVPWAVHTLYMGYVDDAGTPDFYVYVDTLFPEGGVHPYTKDVPVGAFY